MILAESMRHTAATALRPVGSLMCPMRSELAGGLAPGPFLLDPLVVLRELVDRGDAADLGLEAGGGHRGALGPLDRVLDGGDVDQVEAVEQLLGLAVGAVGDDGRLAGEVDDDAF